MLLYIFELVILQWEDLCKAYLVEARWYHTKYMPTFKEYLDIAEVSISVPLMLTHISFVMNVCSTEEVIQSMDKIKNLIHYSSLILRLADDLGTSSVTITISQLLLFMLASIAYLVFLQLYHVS